MDVSENSGFSPKSSILKGFSIIFTIHFHRATCHEAQGGVGRLVPSWNVGSTRHAQAVMCFRLCLCSSQRGGSTQICFFSFFVGKQRNPNPTSTIFVLLEQKPPKSFWLEKKQVLENKLTKDPNFDDGETEELSDFIHLTFGAPKC